MKFCAQPPQGVIFNLLTEISGVQPCIEAGIYGGDVGPRTEKLFAAALEDAKTIFWNGPVGKFEVAEFAHGTSSVARAMAQATTQGVITIIGGGDSVSAVEGLGFGDSSFSHVSTGNNHGK
jgi:phosphoglycerate kinase